MGTITQQSKAACVLQPQRWRLLPGLTCTPTFTPPLLTTHPHQPSTKTTPPTTVNQLPVTYLQIHTGTSAHLHLPEHPGCWPLHRACRVRAAGAQVRRPHEVSCCLPEQYCPLLQFSQLH